MLRSGRALRGPERKCALAMRRFSARMLLDGAWVLPCARWDSARDVRCRASGAAQTMLCTLHRPLFIDRKGKHVDPVSPPRLRNRSCVVCIHCAAGGSASRCGIRITKLRQATRPWCRAAVTHACERMQAGTRKGGQGAKEDAHPGSRPRQVPQEPVGRRSCAACSGGRDGSWKP